LSDFILHAVVAAGHAWGRSVLRHDFSLRCPSLDGFTQVTQPQGCGYKIAQFRYKYYI